jgi:putative oxidoreductase
MTFLDARRDELIAFSRVLLMALFLIFGWSKLAHFGAAVQSMAAVGAPLPALFATFAVIIELSVGVALVVGFRTRAFSLAMFVYTVCTALIGHHFWTMTGPQYLANMVHFYKNLSIAGGLLLLCVTGPGRISVDGRQACGR